MAAKKHINEISGEKLLDRIRVQAMFNNKSPKAIFRTESLKESDDQITEKMKQKDKSRYNEWDNYKSAAIIKHEKVIIQSLSSENLRFKTYLKELEEAYLQRYLIPRDKALQELVLLGQEILHRKYFALMLNPDKKIILSSIAAMIVETGSSAIQILGRTPAGPKHPYRKFNNSRAPKTSSLGIEILSSGSFPDWADPALRDLRSEGKISKMGFENVIEAAIDTPRSHALKKLLDKGIDLSPLSFPMFHRMMLDLELMRLGQATTPGTYNMLLNSFYNGALFVDHSTNVSEQVQIIYEEENWKSPYQIKPDKNPKEQAVEAANKLLTKYFLLKSESIINRDHPREARIEFSSDTDPNLVRTFFAELIKLLKNGIKREGKGKLKIAPVHKVVPSVRLMNPDDNITVVKKMIDLIVSIGFKELYITADIVYHQPGLLQYFPSIKDTNTVIKYAKTTKVKLLNGRTIDIVATSNKAIEAAAGAIESGQGCIKIGLLGLTYEQMKEFIRRVKKGLNSYYKRQENQLLVFIGIIDRPIVSNNMVYEKPFDVSEKFIELMTSLRHDILLIDTMDKGEDDKRLVDAHDIKGGHFTAEEVRKLNRKAQKGRCDLWVAGSYTEQQVYETSMDSPEERPSLICLGGAERSFGGLRLDPREAFTPAHKSTEENKLSALLDYDADVKFMLSRENKLARDAGHVVGELKRRRSNKWDQLDKMRKDYLKVRDNYFKTLAEYAKELGLLTKNIDTLIFKNKEIFKKLSADKKKKMKRLQQIFETSRIKYVDSVSEQMFILFKDEWIKVTK